MRFKTLVCTALAVLVTAVASAVPAKPGAFSYTQPDGSVVMLERHGDEFFSWTTFAGTRTVVALDANGFWRPSSIDTRHRAAARQRREEINRKRVSNRAPDGSNPMAIGERHIPVFLVSFTDVKFSIPDPRQQFTALLNEHGYSANGATGSVQDFYSDNSHGAFTPVFDLYGPVELPNNEAFYGAQTVSENDRQPELALYHAAKALDDEVDFSKYDTDGDGYVDMVLFYYAGYSQAEGGSQDSIWPHQWTMQASASAEARNARFDGKRIGAYFCTAELTGGSGSNMCGIGATCHEFGHSLGLPDFYDSDYSENGSAGGLYRFSVMCGGSYNNGSRTPPHFNAEERIILGWMSEDDVPELPEGDLAFTSIQNNVTYKSLTDTDGEYFLYECRDGSAWDAPLPKGMVVYHVDKSKNRRVGGISPYDQWAHWEWYNTINAYGDHPCFYLVVAANQSALDFNGALGDMVFPGNKKKTEYSSVDWDGNKTGVTLKNISYDSGTVSLTTEFNIQRKIIGEVRDQYGKPIEGVYVVLSQPAAGAPLRKAPRRVKAFETLSGKDGSFVLNLDGYSGDSAHLTFSRSNYTTTGQDITLERRITHVSVRLMGEGESQVIEYSYYDPTSDQYLFGDGETNSLMAAIRIPASDLPAEGGAVRAVTFYPQWQAAGYYVIVDSGEERILTKKVRVTNDSFVKIDLKADEATFTSDEDLYVGVAIERAQTYPGYQGFLFTVTPGYDNCYLSYFNIEKSEWGGSEGYALVLSAAVSPASSGFSQEIEIDTLADMGFNSISDPGHGKYEPGTAFALDLSLAAGVEAESVVWTFDGTDVSGAKSVVLEKGRHTITAALTTTDGASEVLELVLEI